MLNPYIATGIMKITSTNTTSQALVHFQDFLHLPKWNLRDHTPSTAQDTAELDSCLYNDALPQLTLHTPTTPFQSL